MTEFLDFPMAKDGAPYPHHSELKQYFRDYAKHFGLYDDYRFNTEVVSVRRREGGGWTVASECWGELLHACDYRNPDLFEGKRVLIVGCGNSACDIAVDAVHRAKSVDLSVRRGYYFLPKFIAGKPTDTLGGAIKMPRRDVQSLDGSTVHFADGEQADYDLVMLATGYHLHYPFLDRQHLNWPDSAGALTRDIVRALEKRKARLFSNRFTWFASVLWRIAPSLYQSLVRRKFAVEMEQRV